MQRGLSKASLHGCVALSLPLHVLAMRFERVWRSNYLCVGVFQRPRCMVVVLFSSHRGLRCFDVIHDVLVQHMLYQIVEILSLAMLFERVWRSNHGFSSAFGVRTTRA
eukprot:TRINITY_DN3183_c0_g1_i3.p3 TRINITY_DN3183_c0_g1~~TRINITY_DN3183_c0_g1_i3.p3  ORF type:complete len:108 (-),score=9.99 TRINITY_DN3183_c0_g1_i3:250-573(-)